MRRVLRYVALSLFVSGIAPGLGASIDPPVAVSPGSPNRIETIEQSCPTFSWGAVDRAEAYELVVFRADDAQPGKPQGRRRRVSGGVRHAPEIFATIPAQASSWTPSLGQCLEPGERYVWYVREVGARSSYVGEWSEGTSFAVATERAGRRRGRDDDSDSDHDSDSARGGIPEVLSRLARIQRQLADHEASVGKRFDLLSVQIAENQAATEARLRALNLALFGPEPPDDGFLVTHHESVQPCTPERWRAGKCAENNHPADIHTTFCFTVGLAGELGLEYGFEPGISIDLGGEWSAGPKVTAQFDLETPMLLPLSSPIPQVPIGTVVALPDLKMAAGFGSESVMEICFEGLLFEVSQLEGTQAADAFAQQLVDALELRAGDLIASGARFVEEKDLSPDRFATALENLRELRPAISATSDPLLVLKEGGLRDFVDGLPIDTEVRTLLDNPGQIVPQFDREEPFASCTRLGEMEILGSDLQDACGFVTEDVPDFSAIAATVENLAADAAAELCARAPNLCNAGPPDQTDRLVCRRNCRQVSRDCKAACGRRFACRRGCEQDEKDCLNGCN